MENREQKLFETMAKFVGLAINKDMLPRVHIGVKDVPLPYEGEPQVAMTYNIHNPPNSPRAVYSMPTLPRLSDSDEETITGAIDNLVLAIPGAAKLTRDILNKVDGQDDAAKLLRVQLMEQDSPISVAASIKAVDLYTGINKLPMLDALLYKIQPIE